MESILKTVEYLECRKTFPQVVLCYLSYGMIYMLTDIKCRCTSLGTNFAPATFYPYQSYIVASDHLLTGYVNDITSLDFRLCPSAEIRSKEEVFMFRLLSDLNLTRQNRLCDHDKRPLYSMNMNEVYVILFACDLSFCIVLKVISEVPRKCTYWTDSRYLFKLLNHGQK